MESTEEGKGFVPTITGHTQVIGLIGTNVSESQSPAMHTASFAHMGIDCVYLSSNVPAEKLKTAVEGMRDLGYLGFSVTIPHKTNVAPYLDEVSETAKLMGAVNTVKIKDGKCYGDNTDGAGFMRNLKEHGVDILGKTITIVGGGGAGSGVLTQAALDGVAKIHVFNIKDQYYDNLAKRLTRIADATNTEIKLYDLADQASLGKCVTESVLFVNATRVGMPPLDNECVLPEKFLHPGLVVADTVYIPRETKLLRMAASHGNKTIPGIGMLLWQGSIAEDIWVGKAMDVSYIEKLFY